MVPACLGAIVFAISGCGRSASRDAVIVSGASTLYPILQMAAEELRKDQDINISVQAGGSTRGFEDCIAGRNTMGAMARDLTPEEAGQVVAFPIALDGVGIAVHQSNPIQNLTLSDLRRIYRKEAGNWSAFGGEDLAIVVVHKGEGHATRESFREYAELTLEEMNAHADAVGGDNAQVIRIVANTRGAIGYVSLGEVMASADAGMPLRLVRLENIEPTLDNVANGTYPIFRKLSLISKGEPQGGNRVLLDFLRADQGREIIRRGMYVPL